MSSIMLEDVYSNFLGCVNDFDLVKFSDEEFAELLNEYLRRTISNPYVMKMFASLNVDDEVIEFEMKRPIGEQFDIGYVTEVIVKGMLVNWLEPQLKSKINTSQVFGTKEEKFYSQAQHLSELRGLYEDARLEFRKLIRERSTMYNSYLDG